MKKVAIPGKKPGGFNSLPDSVFGRSEVINIIEIDETENPTKIQVIPNSNKNEDGGVGVNIAQTLKKFEVSAVLLENIGPNGFYSLKKEQIPIYSFNLKGNEKVIDVLKLYLSDQLPLLNEPNRNPFFGSERKTGD